MTVTEAPESVRSKNTPTPLYRAAFLFIVLFNSCARRKCQDVKSCRDACRRSAKCRQGSFFFFFLTVHALGLKAVMLKFSPSPPTGELAFLACRTAASPPIPTRDDPCGVTPTHTQTNRGDTPGSIVSLDIFMQTISCQDLLLLLLLLLFF